MDINRYTPSFSIHKIHMTKLSGYTTEELFELLYATKTMKAKFLAHEDTRILNGITVALLFGDTSLRTRTAIEIAVRQLGGDCVNLTYNENDMSAGENFKDIVNVISRYGVGAIITRGISQKDLDDLREVSSIPIINSTNEDFSPMQVICDLFTIWEKKGRLENLKLAYIGKGTPVAATLLMGAVKCGLNVAVATPEQFPIKQEHIDSAYQYGDIEFFTSPLDAARDADVVYTDSYCYHASPTLEEKKILQPYKITPSTFAAASHGAVFMHPLPATRGLEVSPEIIDGKMSIVYDQGGNKLHAIKAILALLVK